MRVLLFMPRDFPALNSTEKPFVFPELQFLKTCFDKIIIIPTEIISDDFFNEIKNDPTIELDISLANQYRRKRLIYICLILLKREFWTQAIKCLDKIISSRKAFREFVSYFIRLQITIRWGRKKIEKLISNNELILYTYWFDVQTNAFAYLKKKYSKMIVVTRAHGHDLYHERSALGIKLGRLKALRNINKVYSVSIAGANYIKRKFPECADIIDCKHMGICFDTNDVRLKFERSNVFRIISCSYLVSIKRVGLLVDSLVFFAHQFPMVNIIWDHIGGGPLLKELDSYANAKFSVSKNITNRFLGNLKNEQVIEHYRCHSYDVFISVSSTEGIPVSMMEAQYFGIPVLATAVGGVPEIILPGTGYLLSKDYSFEEFSSKLYSMITEDSCFEMRKNARKNWNEKFNAYRNYKDFSSSLECFLMQRGD